MAPRLLILIALLAAPAALAQPVDGAAKAGPRLLSHLARAPRSNEPLKLVTVWNAPPGGRPGPCVGRVCAETCPPDQLSALLAAPRLVAADLPATYRPRLDVAGDLIGLPQARASTGLTGRGVLVAIIDTGLDWTHPDFIDAQGRTRVAWLLDQSLAPAGQHPELEQVGQGAVFSAAEIQASLQSGAEPLGEAGLDAIGHGTHVAGIAAGDDPVYTGVAPEARLVIVKAIDANMRGFSEDRVLAGLAFARAVALREGQPLVVNLSLGSQLGAHDGSEPVELALQELTSTDRPSCAVTVAAGNEAELDIHARGAVRAGGPALEIQLLVPQTAPPAADLPARIEIDVWAEGDSQLTALLQAPSGWRSDPVSPGPAPHSQTTWSPDGLVDIAAPAAPNPTNGLIRLTFGLRGEAGLPLAPGTWILRFVGQARRIDAWIGDWDLAGGPVPRFIDRVEPAELVGPPATARGVIAVGATDARTTWVGADGVEYGLTGAATGERSPFSVSGPTRDGRLKPELLAPGRTVAAAMSSQATAFSPTSIFYTGGSQRKVMPDGRHAVASGTSMAAPFAAGACALVLQREPELTGQELLGRIQISGGADEQTGHGLFDPGWGFGKLRVDGLLDGPAAEGAPPDPAASLCGVGRTWMPIDDQQLVRIAAVPRSEAGRPLGPGRRVQIDAKSAAFAGPVIDHGTGLYTRAMQASGARGRRIRPICSTEGQPAEARPEVVLAGSAEEVSAGGVRGGGIACAAAARRSGGLQTLCLWLGLVGISLRSRSSRSSSRKSSRCNPSPRTRT